MLEVKANTAPQWHSRVDQWGMLASAACGLHCMLLPLLLAVFPVLGSALSFSEQAEAIFIASALIISAASLALGMLRHGQFTPALALWCLGAAIFLTWGIGHDHHPHGHAANHVHAGDWGHALAMAFGGFALSLAHYSNWRALARCEQHEH